MQNWKYISKMVVRRTGFPFEWLNRIVFEKTVAHMDKQLEREESLQREIEVLLKGYFTEQVKTSRMNQERQGLKLLSKYRKKVAKAQVTVEDLKQVERLWPNTAFQEQFAKVVTLIEEVKKLHREGEAIFVEELKNKRGDLRELVRDPHFGEAVFISNPDVYENSYLKYIALQDVETRTARQKILEKRFVSYLQRFAAKNDTASFFGPMNYARLDWKQKEPVKLDMVNGKFTKRSVFYSFWMTQVLADVIAKEPSIRPYLAPRLHPLCKLTELGAQYLFLDGKRHLPPHLLRLLRDADGTTTLQELASGYNLPAKELYKQVEWLVKKRLLLFSIEIPSTIFGPFDYLCDFLRSLPDHVEAKGKWIAELDRFEGLRTEFENATLESRVEITKRMEKLFVELTRHATRRLAGKTYADRTLYYEECKGTIRDLSFNKVFFEDFHARMEPVLQLIASYGEMMRGYYQRVGKRVFQQIAQGEKEIPYVHFIRKINEMDQEGKIDYRDDIYHEFHQKLRDLVTGKREKNVVRLTREDLGDLFSHDVGDSLHTSPDLMIAAKNLEGILRGDYQIVLGEVHQFVSMWGSQFLFDSDREAVEREIEQVIRGLPAYRKLATILNTRRHKGLLYEAFPGTLIQFLGKPSKHAKNTIPLRDLVVRMEGDELVLADQHSKETFNIYNSGDDNLHLWAFAVPRVASIPIHFEQHTPRIEINGVVYQRERWVFPSQEFLSTEPKVSDYEMFLRMRRVKQRHQLPRWVFVRVEKEKKPYYLDFDSFFLVELLQGHLKNHNQVTMIEMHPDPDHLWMRDEEGSYCMEMRGTAFRPPLPGSKEYEALQEEVELEV